MRSQLRRKSGRNKDGKTANNEHINKNIINHMNNKDHKNGGEYPRTYISNKDQDEWAAIQKIKSIRMYHYIDSITQKGS